MSARVAQTPPTDLPRPKGMTDCMVECDECHSEWGWGASYDRCKELAAGHNRERHNTPRGLLMVSSNAEKAWEEFVDSLELDFAVGWDKRRAHLYVGFKAGYAFRDAEVAALRERVAELEALTQKTAGEDR